MSDPKDPPSEVKPDSPEHPKAKADTTGLEGGEAEQILASIRRNEFLSGVVDGRDVSLVYIDRHQIHNYFEPERARPEDRRPADAAPQPQRRIGDLVLSPLPAWERERTAAVYLTSPLFEEALRRLRESGVLFLYGPRGTGKRATAIRLLNGITFDDDQGVTYELNPSLRLTELRSDDLPEQTRLLLESAAGDALDGLNRFQLDALCRALNPGSRYSALVVITESLPAGFPRDYRHLALEWRLPWSGSTLEAQREALVRHVRYLTFYTPEYETVIEPQLRRLDELTALNQVLAKGLSPSDLADLAELLGPALRGEISVDQALAGLAQRAYKDVEAWFNQGHRCETENLLIAAAVFSGAPYSDVREAARRLETYLQPETADKATDEKPVRPASRFAGRDSRQAQLEAIQARPVETSRRTHYGEVLEDAIELNNPAWQEAVLRFAWDDTEFGGRILDWLKAYGANASHHLRTRAAAAIGSLARHSFSTIEANILRTWAASSDVNTRRSAAQVLGITIWDDTFSAPSARLLHYWAGQTDQPRWQWTAATAYAGLAGPRYPVQTLADLKLIAGDSLSHPGLLEPVLRAVWAFYGSAQSLPERRLALLEELASWGADPPTDKKDSIRAFALRRVAVMAFWNMLWPERNDPVWSLLLADAGAPGRPQTLAVQLMRRSFNFRQPKDTAPDDIHPRRYALEGLHSLLNEVCSHRDGGPQAYLDGLLTALVSACQPASPDEVERLRYHALQWQDSFAEANDTLRILMAG